MQVDQDVSTEKMNEETLGETKFGCFICREAKLLAIKVTRRRKVIVMIYDAINCWRFARDDGIINQRPARIIYSAK